MTVLVPEVVYADPRGPVLQNRYDSSLFIKVFIEGENDIEVILRPPKFGKSYNLQMLRDYFSNHPDGQSERRANFNGMEIMKDEVFRENHMFKYSVIYI